MTIWALADLHLSFSAPDKDMAFFGPVWQDYAQKIEANWRQHVQADDLVLLAGDLSWALKLQQALLDLEWIASLPGTKVCIRGNHDYWWTSLNKIRQLAPPSMHFLQHDCFNWDNVSISGTRLWDSPEYTFSSYVQMVENPRQKAPAHESPDPMIFERELGRLEMALRSLSPQASTKIIMTHYPPISADLQPSRTSALLEAYGVQICLFGHLHNLRPNQAMFGTRNGVRYVLTSADYLNFAPIRLLA